MTPSIFNYKKKGNAIVDGLLVVVILFAVALMILLGYKIFGDVNDDIQVSNDMDNESKQMAADLYARYPIFFDNLYITIIVLLWLVILVLSLIIDANPVFFIFAVILLIGVMIVGVQLANAYGEFIEDDEISPISAEFPKINWVFEHFLTLVLGIVFTTGAALFAKSKM